MCKKVSIVIPTLNESRYIDMCIESLIYQTYPQNQSEWIFVDGGSTDSTLEKLNEIKQNYIDKVYVLNNPKKSPASAMNLGIKEAHGDIIIRFDAHTKYPEDYVQKCTGYLEQNIADNVGGHIITIGDGYWGGINAGILSSKFGVGNSEFRIDGKSSYVDTVPFGAFKRSLFDKVGFFNEMLIRSEDNELNYRIRTNGGKVFLANDILSTYYCRDSLGGMLKMAIANGKAVATTSFIAPGAMSLRHYIPFLFTSSILVAGINILFFSYEIINKIFALEMGLYLVLNIFYSQKAINGAGFGKRSAYVLTVFLFHLCYGIGTFIDLTKYFFKSLKQR